MVAGGSGPGGGPRAHTEWPFICSYYGNIRICSTPVEGATRPRQYRDINRESQELSRYIALPVPTPSRRIDSPASSPRPLTEGLSPRSPWLMRGGPARDAVGGVPYTARSPADLDPPAWAHPGSEGHPYGDHRTGAGVSPPQQGGRNRGSQMPAPRWPGGAWETGPPEHREDSRRTDDRTPLTFQGGRRGPGCQGRGGSRFRGPCVSARR